MAFHVTVHLGNHDAGVNDVVMDIGNDYVGIYHELGLQLNNQR